MGFRGQERRQQQRWSCAIEVTLCGADTKIDGLLRDISKSGARITVPSRATPKSPLVIEIPNADGVMVSLSVALVRNQPSQGEDILGLRFDPPAVDTVEPLIAHIRAEQNK